MRFTITKEAGERLGIDPKWIDYEFDGPTIRETLLGGFPNGVTKWLKKTLKVERIETLDVFELRLSYYMLTMRNMDHTILPFSRWDDVAVADFELAKHVVTSFDQDGDCGECSRPLDDRVHLQDDDSPEIPPTPAPVGAGTSETATP